jgi:hypothetical protein
VAIGDACKHIVQIVQLLDERRLSLSFCLNRNEILVQVGFGLLFQTLNLARDGKLIKDCNRLVCSVMDMLERGSAAGSMEFRYVHHWRLSDLADPSSRTGCSMITVPQVERMSAPTLSRHNSEGHMSAPAETFRATQKSLKALAARFSPGAPKVLRHEQQDARRATLATITPNMGTHANPSSTSLSSVRSEPHTARSEPTMSPMSQHRASFSVADKRRQTQLPSQHRNIDYLSFASDPLATYAMNHNGGIKSEVSASDWERLLSSLDSGQTNIYDNIYGGPPAEALLDAGPLSTRTDSTTAWSPPAWSWGSSEQAPPPQSVLSFTDESLTSGDDFGNACDFGSTPSSDKVYASIMIPDMSTPTGLGALDGTFGL